MTKKQKRRYNLHYKIRKQGFLLKTNKKTIFVCLEKQQLSRQCLDLQKEFDYAIQTTLI